MEKEKDWHVCRLGGLWQWLLAIGSLSLYLFGFILFGSITEFRPDRENAPVGRPDVLFIPVVSFALATYGLVQARRIRLRWNTSVFQDKSKFFEFREYNWRDLTDVELTADGVGRVLVFGRLGRINMRPNVGQCAIPMNDIWEVEAFAKEKLRENAGAARS